MENIYFLITICILFNLLKTNSGSILNLNLNLPEKLTTYAIEENKNLGLALGYNEDSLDNFTVITKNYGYSSETHTVVTEDGYILTMFRIPKGKNCRGEVKNTPILMVHGLFDTSDTYIIAGPGVGLGYILADNCYDIWCGNSRGNRYSRRHATLDPDRDASYWNFTFDHMGMYDLPAFIDYILKETSSKKINYIGHSQGTTDFFILASTRVEYNDKIGVAINLAPVAWCTNIVAPLLQFVAQASTELKLVAGLIGAKEIFGHKGIPAVLLKLVCQYVPRYGCGPLALIILGYDVTETTTETIRAGLGHFPSGTSVDNLDHFGQALRVDRFRRYDYGEVKNLEVYGTSEPPDFDVTKISTQVALICGKNDWLVNLKDVAKLRPLLPNLVDYTLLDPEDWNHVDFVWGDRIPINLAPKVLDLFNNYG